MISSEAIASDGAHFEGVAVVKETLDAGIVGGRVVMVQPSLQTFYNSLRGCVWVCLDVCVCVGVCLVGCLVGWGVWWGVYVCVTIIVIIVILSR